MDELARRYILLGLRLERLAPGFLDSYVGPQELADAANAGPPPIAADLHDEALALRELVTQLDASVEPRKRWMEGQLRSIAVQARRAGGEEIAYLDLVEQLYGVDIAGAPESELLAARDRMDAALDGDRSLAQRLDAFRATQRVPPERVMDALRGSAERFRSVTRGVFGLPPGEEIVWEEVRDRPWGAYATFIGDGRTRIIINLDLPLDVGTIAYLAWHEAYPGHHTELVTKERSLVAAGVAEARLRTMNTPEALMSEGLADVGREVVMSDEELGVELEAIGRDVGLEADWAAALEVNLAAREQEAVLSNVALMLHHQGRPEAEVRDWIQEVSPREPKRLDHLIRTTSDPVLSTYPFTYTIGARIIRPWLATVGPVAGFERLLSEQLSPAQLLAET